MLSLLQWYYFILFSFKRLLLDFFYIKIRLLINNDNPLYWWDIINDKSRKKSLKDNKNGIYRKVYCWKERDMLLFPHLVLQNSFFLDDYARMIFNLSYFSDRIAGTLVDLQSFLPVDDLKALQNCYRVTILLSPLDMPLLCWSLQG